jgi:dienelactone hydrolase
MNKLLLVLLLIAGPALAFTQQDVVKFQPETIASQPPDNLLIPGDKIEFYTTNRGFGNFLPQVPTFDNQGKLLASWTPNSAGVKNHPTFIFLHGGHGITGLDIGSAVWAKKELGANILVLDSYWSRGVKENWVAYNNMGANMRALDAIAAGKFVISQGVDKDSIFLMGESQGGWAVLRAFTDDPFFNKYNGMFRAGIAVYPVCKTGWHDTAPDLGPYNGTVIVFTAGLDTATPISQCDKSIFTQTAFWKHYPDATHGFDIIFKGMLKDNPPDYDGECVKAMNVYNHFTVCRNNAATEDMHNKIRTMVRMLTPYYK